MHLIIRFLYVSFFTVMLVNAENMEFAQARSQVKPQTVQSFAHTFTMTSAVSVALDRHPNLTSAKAGYDASVSGRSAALGAFGPTASLEYGYNRRESSVIYKDKREEYSAAAVLRQPLFTGGRLTASYQKADREVDRQEAGMRIARLEMIAKVQESYLAYLKAVERVYSAEASLLRLQEQLKVARAFYKEGLRPNIDVLQAEHKTTEAELVLLMAGNEKEQQRVRLNTLLMERVDSPLEYIGNLNHISFPYSFEQALELALKQRPDLLQAEKAVEVAKKDVTIARSGLYPQLSADLSWHTRGDQWRAAGTKDGEMGYSYWQVGVGAKWEVFSWGSTWNEGQRSKHLEWRAVAEEESLQQEVVYEVRSRLLALQESEKRIAVANRGMTQAAETYKVALARYQAQVGNSTELLDAHAALSEAEAVVIGAKADYLTALSKMWVSLGEEHLGL